MKLHLVVALAVLASLVPVAAARIDTCQLSPDTCIPPSYFVNGCHVNGLAVRADAPIGGCAARLAVCSFDYFGGSPSFLGNFVWYCSPVLA